MAKQLVLGLLVLACVSVVGGPVLAQSQGVGVTITQSTGSPGPTSSPGTTAQPGSTLAPGATLAPAGAGGSNVLGSSTGPGGTGDLPKTGTDIVLLVATAIALIALGAVLAGVAERRRRLTA